MGNTQKAIEQGRSLPSSSPHRGGEDGTSGEEWPTRHGDHGGKHVTKSGVLNSIRVAMLPENQKMQEECERQRNQVRVRVRVMVTSWR